MEPKRYIGNDLHRLYGRIRRDIGPDALILRTRSLLREGAEPLVEILAVPADDDHGLPPALERAMVQSVLSRVDPSFTVGDLEDMVARESAGTFSVTPPSEEPRVPPSSAPVPGLYSPDESDDVPFDEALLLDQLAAELERRASSNVLTLPTEPETLPADRFLSSSPARQRPGDLRSQLRDAGFSVLSAETIVEIGAGERDPVKAISVALTQGSLSYPDEDQTAILTVQGATGSGRTTALLRMAVDCAQAGRPAVIVSATRNRQTEARLRTFAEAAGIPFEATRDPRAIGNMARRSEKGTCLFLDVPEGAWRMPLPGGVRHYRYLAVPAAASTEQLAEAVGGFDLRPFSGAVLTFGDNARTLLPAVDFLIGVGLGIAFVSDGPDASTGIALADPFMLASGTFTTSTGVTTDGRLTAIA